MRISIFGMGYVGCVSGACLAALGHRVIGVEPNPVKVKLINSGKSPIVEKDLDALIEKAVKNGLFSTTEDWWQAVDNSDLAMVCVGTPGLTNGSIDLRFVSRVCEQIGEALISHKTYFTIVIRSTVLPGTVERTLIPILEECSGKKAGVDFGVCMNPEFLREGTSVHDFHNPPQTVIGQLNSQSGEALAALYQSLPGPITRVPIGVAEMLKYVNNTFHALKVCFANEIGNLAKELGVDSHRVMDIFCLDTKLNLSPYYLKPGFAFGGSCLPKDLRAITSEARMLDVNVPVLNSILESNQLQIQKVTTKLLEYKGMSLGFFGLSFKGGTDDLRESPIVEVIEFMLGNGFQLKIYDRHVSLAKLIGTNKEYIEREILHISRLMCATAAELMQASDVIIIANHDDEFKAALAQVRPHQAIIDLVRIIDSKPTNAGSYYGICW